MNLSSLISEAIDQSGSDDHNLVIKTVIEALGPKQIEEALTIALHPLVKYAFSQRRRNAFDKAQTGTNPDTSSLGHRRTETQTCIAEGRTKQKHTPSRKVAAIRDWWTELLNQQAVSSTGQTILIGDMTLIDVIAAIDERKRQAQANIARAEQFEALKRILEHSGARTLREVERSDIPAKLH